MLYVCTAWQIGTDMKKVKKEGLLILSLKMRISNMKLSDQVEVLKQINILSQETHK